MSTDLKLISSSKTISGIPAIHYNSYLSNFDNKYNDDKFYLDISKLVDTVLSCNIQKTPKYIVLCGTPGSGKTHFSVGLYRALVNKLGYIQGDGAMFLTFMDLAAEIISLFQYNIPIRTSLSGYEQPRWLFLDDFTSSERIMKQDSMEFNIFRDILIDRYEKDCVLITSCNFDSIDFLASADKLFGGYITSRLINSKIVQFPNKDFRKIKK